MLAFVRRPLKFGAKCGWRASMSDVSAGVGCRCSFCPVLTPESRIDDISEGTASLRLDNVT